MPSYRVSVVRPALPRLFALLLLLSAFVFAMGCGHSSSTTPTTPAGPAPTFTSKPSTIAQEGVGYSYNITTTTTDSSTVTYKLTSGPDGAAITDATLSWIPTHAESRTAQSFTITATTSKNGTATQTFSVTPNGNVNGTVVDHAVTGTGLQDYPEDLSGVTIEAFVPDGSGGYNVLKGSGDNQGNFSIPNVPPGSFLLHLPQVALGAFYDNYIWTSSSDIDGGSLLTTRGDSVFPSQPVTINTNVTLTVTPASSDTVQWASPDVEAFGQPASVTQPLVSSFQQEGYLIDSTKGDRAFLTHYQSTSPTADSTVNSIVEAKEYDSITETSGGTVNLTGTMSAVGGSTMDPVIKATQFDALFTGHTNDGYVSRNFSLLDPGYDGSEGYSGGVYLIDAFLNTDTDTDLGNISYGAVTSNGVPYYVYSDFGYRDISNPSGLGPFPVGSTVVSNVIPTSGSPIVPVIGLVQSPLINGLDFYTDQPSLSASPTVAWNAPSVGTGTFYTVSVMDVSNTTSFPAWYFYTDKHSVTVPRGLLQAGHIYVFQITANNSSTTFATAPFRQGATYAYSTTTSGAMTIASSSATKKKLLAPRTGTKHLVVATDLRGRLHVQQK